MAHRVTVFLSLLWALFVFYMFGAFRLFFEPVAPQIFGYMLLVWLLPTLVAWCLLTCMAWVIRPRITHD